MKIKEGTILVLEHGEYSDYTFDGPFRVLKEFDQAIISAEFRAQFVPPYQGARPDESDFIGWLARNGYVENLAAHRWHIGCYEFEPEIQDETQP